MEILKPYAHIRLMAKALSEKLSLGDDIHWLRLSEVGQVVDGILVRDEMNARIRDRKERFSAFKMFSFPDIISLDEMRDLITGKTQDTARAYDGEPLSAGVVRGEVRIVTDPHAVDVETWPQDTILVAETTDPGWTPLFARAKAIVVERGGVLSHCAILAREMQIPAVSGIHRASKSFKDGDKLWVDGNYGRIVRES